MSETQVYSIERVLTDINWLVLEIGPRPAYSSQARLAALGIRDRLEEAGWETNVAQLPNNIVACRGNGKYLLLAHSDSVQNSPGAIDNASGVATLLELARTTKAKDICLGFPAQEEIGLIGSKHMVEVIEKWHPSSEELDLVVSLDLVGHGTLSITGLGNSWGQGQLQWLYGQISPFSEYGYQVVSNLLPSNERSDHAYFADAGYLSAQLLGRNKDGIFPNYHQPTDTTTESEALIELAEQLERLITSENDIPNGHSSFDASIVFQQTVVPSWSVWSICIIGSVVGLQKFPTDKMWLISFCKAAAILLVLGIVSGCVAGMSLFDSNSIEVTTHHLKGLPETGWWNAAPWCAGIFLFGMVITHYSRWVSGPPSFIGGLLTLLLMFIEPLLAFPMAVATIASRIWAPLICIGGIYWIQPSILRELTFHGLISPSGWVLCSLLILPTMFSLPRKQHE
jgi:hypothetical protein